jgi:transcriptional regulator with XRE-family HTH domain
MNLYELREAEGISQARLAVWLNCSQADLERFENGEPTLSAMQIAEAEAILGKFSRAGS